MTLTRHPKSLGPIDMKVRDVLHMLHVTLSPSLSLAENTYRW